VKKIFLVFLVSFLLMIIMWKCLHTERPRKIFFIGNSLTADMGPSEFKKICALNNKPFKVGFHIRPLSTLKQIWENPHDVAKRHFDQRFGTFDIALKRFSWDILVLQPFKGDTLAETKTYIGKYIALVRKNYIKPLKVYIYQGWPVLNDAYSELWTSTVRVSDESVFERNRAMYAVLLHELRAEHSFQDVSFDLIPIGEALFNIDQMIGGGNSKSGLTDISQLYRDKIHLDLKLGRLVALLSVYRAIMNRPSASVTVSDSVIPGLSAISESVRDVIHNAVDQSIIYQQHQINMPTSQNKTMGI
jgi:hypothetical protein